MPDKRLYSVALAAGLIVAVCYGQTLGFGFVWDTGHILTAEGIQQFNFSTAVWVFTNTILTNWHPVSALSHAADLAIFGFQPAGHHAMNILLHWSNAVLVFMVVQALVRAAKPVNAEYLLIVPAVTALIFVVHPIRVENVAWVSQRKDLLYALFTLLALLAYCRYREKGEVRSYALAFTCFCLACLSKSMAVTLPAVLVLLDVYPFRQQLSARLVLLEKLPFWLVTLAMIGVTLWSQEAAISDTGRFTPLDSVRNAIHNSAFYIQKSFVPVGLSPFYSFPPLEDFRSLSYWLPGLLFGIAVTLAGIWLALRNQPLLLVCWLLYLVMLSPASGIIQVGSAASADRYGYLPLVPIHLLVAVTLAWAYFRFANARRLLLATCVLLLVTFTGLTFMQASHWRSDITLWSHVLRVQPNTLLAHFQLAQTYAVLGDRDKTLYHYRQLTSMLPADSPRHAEVAQRLQELGFRE